MDQDKGEGRGRGVFGCGGRVGQGNGAVVTVRQLLSSP